MTGNRFSGRPALYNDATIVTWARTFIEDWIEGKNPTLRSMAATLGIRHTVLHYLFKSRLKDINLGLYLDIKAIMEDNISQRHIRGGKATQVKWLKAFRL